MPRIIDIADSYISATAPNIGAVTASGLQTYVDDAAFETANGAGAAGDMYFNTTSYLIRRHDGTSWANVPEDDTVLHTTGDESAAGQKTFTGNVIVQGDFTVQGTTTQVDTTNTNIKDKNILINDGGDDASSEGAGITVERTGTDGSFIYADAAASKFKCGALGSEVEVADISSTQSLSNKTLTAPVMSSYDDFTHIAKPANPGAGVLRVYAKSDNAMYTLDSAGTETAIGAGGSGSGTGRINYIDAGSSQCETDTGSWTTYDDGAVADPVDGTGGSATVISISQETTDPLNGSGSLKISKTAADGQGEGVSVDFTVDRAELGLVNEISFNYITDANYADGDFAIWIYDVDNGILIQPVPYELLASTTPNRFKAFFQCTYDATTANANDYRLIVHCATNSATTRSVIIDEILIGPPQYNFGTPVTDWESYTPTGSWDTGTYTGKWRRVGDTMECAIQVATSGAPAASDFSVSLPSGFVIDTAKLNDPTAQTSAELGIGNGRDAGTDIFGPFLVTYKDTTSVYLLVDDGDKTLSILSKTNPFTVGNGDEFWLSFKAPILGWSSSVQMSDDADTRVISFKAVNSSTQVVTADTTNIAATATKDSHGAWDGDEFIIPVSGDYVFGLSSGDSASSTVNFDVYTNGAGPVRIANSISGARCNGGTFLPNLVAGDRISFRCTSSVTLWGATYLTGFKLSGPSSIAASETISVIAKRTDATTVTNGSIWTYEDIDENSHGAYNPSTGVFTAPAARTYLVSAYAFCTDSITVANYFEIGLRKNSTLYAAGTRITASATTTNVTSQLAIAVKLNAGETLDIINNSSATRTPLNNGSYNYLSIVSQGF